MEIKILVAISVVILIAVIWFIAYKREGFSISDGFLKRSYPGEPLAGLGLGFAGSVDTKGRGGFRKVPAYIANNEILEKPVMTTGRDAAPAGVGAEDASLVGRRTGNSYYITRPAYRGGVMDFDTGEVVSDTLLGAVKKQDGMVNVERFAAAAASRESSLGGLSSLGGASGLGSGAKQNLVDGAEAFGCGRGRGAVCPTSKRKEIMEVLYRDVMGLQYEPVVPEAPCEQGCFILDKAGHMGHQGKRIYSLNGVPTVEPDIFIP